MIVLIGKRDWVMTQIEQASKQFSTLGQWCQHYSSQLRANQLPVLIQRNTDPNCNHVPWMTVLQGNPQANGDTP